MSYFHQRLTAHTVTTCFIIHPKPFFLQTLTSHVGITIQSCSLHDQSRYIHYSYTIVHYKANVCVCVCVCVCVSE